MQEFFNLFYLCWVSALSKDELTMQFIPLIANVQAFIMNKIFFLDKAIEASFFIE